MNTQGHYQSDLLFYFDGRPQELALYEDLFQAMSAAFPDACVKVQEEPDQLLRPAPVCRRLPAGAAEEGLAGATASW